MKETVNYQTIGSLDIVNVQKIQEENSENYYEVEGGNMVTFKCKLLTPVQDCMIDLKL